jgi:hypothetical protein
VVESRQRSNAEVRGQNRVRVPLCTLLFNQCQAHSPRISLRLGGCCATRASPLRRNNPGYSGTRSRASASPTAVR